MTLGERINAANAEALERILKAQPTVVGVGTAGEDVPGMKKNMVLHAGPPITWERMSSPQKGAVLGGLVYEGLADSIEEAEKIVEAGEIEFSPCHHHQSVGPMAGVVTYSMPVWIIENKAFGNKAYCTLNEGLGKVLRFGAYGDEVIERLHWMEDELYPILKAAMEEIKEIDLKTMIAEVLQMGDEGHNRNKAGTSLLMRILAPAVVRTEGFTDEQKAVALEFIDSNDHSFLNLSMPACKAILDPIEGIEYSTILFTMARNGTDFGIRVAGLPDQWFTGPAQYIEGLYFPGYGKEDANPDIGDSAITETTGIGAFCMAAAPAIVQFIGGTPADAINYSTQMYEITEGESDVFRIPALDFRGAPTGIDIRKVVETGILPVINTGIAAKKPGIGQVGAGIVHPPKNAFDDALAAFVEKYAK